MDDINYVEPDISVICDLNKLTDQGCSGAPDFIMEIVSPSSCKTDYLTKSSKYEDAGVREYRIVDPAKERTTVCRYEEDAAPVIYTFGHDITVGIYGDLTIKGGIAEINRPPRCCQHQNGRQIQAYLHFVNLKVYLNNA